MNEELQENDKEDEISLIDLFAVIWRRKKMIITLVVIAMIGVVAFSVVSLVLPPGRSPLPNHYTPKALMLINNSSSPGGNLSSMLNSSGLGSLASMIGVSAGGGASYSQLAVYLAGTNSLLDAVVDEFDLIARYKVKESLRAGSRKILKKNLKAEVDEKSGVLSIGFTDIDPVFAQGVVNFCVEYLENRFNELGLDKNKIEKENLEVNISNTYQEILRLEQEGHKLENSVGRGMTGLGTLPPIGIELNRIQLELEAQRQIYAQLKIQYELLKVTMASENPVFQILEYAEVLDQKSGPSRGMICIVVTLAAGFFAVFLAFMLNAIENIRKDPEAMAKLRSKKDD